MTEIAAPVTGMLPVVVPGTGEGAVAHFTAFARSSTPSLFRLAYLLCGDEHRAHDLVQLALERTYRAWGRVGDGNPYAYARRVITTARVDAWRRTRSEVLAPHAHLAPDGARGVVLPDAVMPDAAASVAERDRVLRALLALPVKQRRVVLLRYMLDRSEAETAAELGIAVGTVKSTSSRALEQLRTLLRPTDLSPKEDPR